MGITNIFRSQLSAVIQWNADKQHLLWYKYPSKTDSQVPFYQVFLYGITKF